MNKQEFINKVSELGINLTEEQLVQLDTYCNFLLEYNSHTNLTAIKEEDQVYLKHFYDSLTFIKAIDVTKYNNLLDIGTGAGFPGMVLKIVFPNLEVTLLDSNNKKINFLQELSNKLGLTKINFYHGRAEDFCVKNRESFDIVTARAVTNMTALSELCLPLVKLNGYFIALKGSNQDELNDSKNAIKILGGLIEDTINFELPYDGGERNIVRIIKQKNTPKEYPRRYDKIVKKPLK
ncbi:MAG: 16S rRNA (guanine(527)-N(7))-methyltransferase RsmG [Firmicutes bacterium]|nr:16S rRNA (guanine(527)-N(7))-methyltransferase RsmG [Bacillota bacterium]